MALSDKQKRFCDEYAIDFNGTQAAIRAGYSIKTANEQAARLLANVSVQSYLAEVAEKKRGSNELTAQMVINELAKIAFHNVQDFINGGNSILELKFLDREKTAAVSGIKTKVRNIPGRDGKPGEIETETDLKFHSKEKALELLGRHFGIFEKDNEQSKTTINLSNLTVDQLLQLENLLSATTGESK